MKPRFFPFSALLLLAFPASSPGADDPPSRDEAVAALERAIAFYRTEAGHQGAYVYRYSADLSRQEGEGKAYATTGWTQPPGTPAVGQAYLEAWQLTKLESCLNAAVEAARALVSTQLRSGGWDSRFELDPEYRKRYAYRADGSSAGKRNYTTFDDNKSQSALTLLMRVDEALEFRDEQIHEAVEYALQHMLEAQYPNGAWPQQFEETPDHSGHGVKQASYPESWSRTYPKVDYRGHYTLNDNNMAHIIVMFFEAARIYGRADCRQAAERTGDFFLLAQMPEPQPGWAQQYDRNMHPAWARKFEPPSLCGGESQSVMTTLLDLYQWTGKTKYLKPFPRVLEYYRSSLREDGKLARFYELKTNHPLYFTKDYQLTYSDEDMPTHYGFIVSSKLDRIQKRYQALITDPPARFAPPSPKVSPPRLNDSLANRAGKLISALDERGAWTEPGRLQDHGDDDPAREVIESQTFMRNLILLAQFIAAGP